MAEENKNSSGTPEIRTLKSDAEVYATHANEPGAKDKRVEDAIQNKTKSRTNPWFIFGGLALIIIFASIGTYYWMGSIQEKEVAMVTPPIDLIKPDETKTIAFSSLNHSDLARELINQTLSTTKNNVFKILLIGVASSSVIESYANFNQFAVAAEFNLPPKLRDNVTTYSLGLFRKNDQTHPFLILKIKSFNDALNGMLTWEKVMPNDLRLLFNNIPQLGAINEIFSDTVIKNQSARILSLGSESVLAYAFYNKNLLIITDSDKSLAEIINRYGIFPPNQ